MALISTAVSLFPLIASSLVIDISPKQALSYAGSGSATPLTYGTGSTTRLPIQLETSSAVHSANTSILSVNNNGISDCDGGVYGAPSVVSCEDAIKQMSDDHAWVDFGDRTRGTFDVPLPYRYTSGTLPIALNPDLIYL